MRLTKDSLILNKTDVNNMIDRLSDVSCNICKMRSGLKCDNKPRFKKAFLNACREADRINCIKGVLSKMGDNL